MPTIDRILRENDRDNARNKLDRTYFDAMQFAPPSAKHRFDTKSPVAVPLGRCGVANWKTIYVQPDGEVAVHPNHDLGRETANKNREDAALQRAIDMKTKHGKRLFDRRQTKTLAKEEGISVDTVRAMRRRLRKNGHA
jgi:hypothetical protein